METGPFRRSQDLDLLARTGTGFPYIFLSFFPFFSPFFPRCFPLLCPLSFSCRYSLYLSFLLSFLPPFFSSVLSPSLSSQFLMSLLLISFFPSFLFSPLFFLGAFPSSVLSVYHVFPQRFIKTNTTHFQPVNSSHISLTLKEAHGLRQCGSKVLWQISGPKRKEVR